MSQDVCQWIETHADFAPEKIAVRFEGQEITYRQLLLQIKTTAAVLKAAYDIGRGDRIAYLGFNSPELLVLFFACARLGALLLPLNWRLTRPEQAYILENAAARILVCDDDHVTIGHQLSETVPGCKICDHADIAAVTGGTEGRVDRNPHIDLTTPLLLVYTSGTTGQPKGAVLTQEAVLFNALNSVHMHDLDVSDHILTVLPMFHVGGLNIQTTPALYVGATVTLQRRFEPAMVLSAIRDLRPTRLVLVPATIIALAEHPDFKTTDLGSIRSVTTGSTIVQKSVIDIFHDRNVPVIQNYGLTETGPVALYLLIMLSAALGQLAVGRCIHAFESSTRKTEMCLQGGRVNFCCRGRTCSRSTGVIRQRPVRHCRKDGSGQVTSVTVTLMAMCISTTGRKTW